MNLPTPVLILPSVPLPFAPALHQAVALGYTHVAVTARADRPPEDLEALADSGLVVAAAALGEDLPAGCTLDAADVAARRRALEVVRHQVIDAARLGATCAWLRPGTDAGVAAQACFAEACALLADFAGRRMLRLCVTHEPGSALPTAGQALAWVEQMPAAVGLLLDAGRLAPGEDVGAIIRRAGPRLGGVATPTRRASEGPRGRETASQSDAPARGPRTRRALHDIAFRGVLLCRQEPAA
jgi:sugar phosphate isomerase/epimerase